MTEKNVSPKDVIKEKVKKNKRKLDLKSFVEFQEKLIDAPMQINKELINLLERQLIVIRKLEMVIGILTLFLFGFLSLLLII